MPTAALDVTSLRCCAVSCREDVGGGEACPGPLSSAAEHHGGGAAVGPLRQSERSHEGLGDQSSCSGAPCSSRPLCTHRKSNGTATSQVTEALKAEFNKQMVAVVSKHEAVMAEMNQKLEDQLKQARAARAPAR